MRKKKKQIETTRIKKSPQVKTQNPTKLCKLIELINLVPPDVNLPEWGEVWQRQIKIFSSEDSDEQRKEKIQLATQKTFEECFKHFPEETKHDWAEISFAHHCLMQPHKDPSELLAPSLFYVLISKYADMRQIREDLRGMSDYFSYLRERSSFATKENDVSSDRVHSFRFPQITSRIQLTGTIMEPVPTGLGEAIYKVDGDKIRACVICNRIFWAKRQKSKTCSSPCFNALRQHRHRVINKEKINAKRRENYRYKKLIQKKEK